MINKFRDYIENATWDEEVIRQDEAARPVLLGIVVATALMLAWCCSEALYRLFAGLWGG